MTSPGTPPLGPRAERGGKYLVYIIIYRSGDIWSQLLDKVYVGETLIYTPVQTYLHSDWLNFKWRVYLSVSHN